MRAIATFTDAPIILDPHFPPSFYAALWGIDQKTVLRWFQDRDDVLKLQKTGKRGTRTEIRIPWSVAMKVYHERTQGKACR